MLFQGEREPFAKKPVAPVTKIVLFSKNGSIRSNSMREEIRDERVNDDDLKQKIGDLISKAGLRVTSFFSLYI